MFLLIPIVLVWIAAGLESWFCVWIDRFFGELLCRLWSLDPSCPPAGSVCVATQCFSHASEGSWNHSIKTDKITTVLPWAQLQVPAPSSGASFLIQTLPTVLTVRHAGQCGNQRDWWCLRLSHVKYRNSCVLVEIVHIIYKTHSFEYERETTMCTISQPLCSSKSPEMSFSKSHSHGRRKASFLFSFMSFTTWSIAFRKWFPL